MDIVISGRNVEVPDHFRDHASEKLARLARYDHKIVRFAVELSHEPNPRRSKNCQRVQITGRGRGPVVRGEGCGAEFLCALDQAVSRLEERLRRSHDRRRVHHGRRQPISVARAVGALAPDAGPAPVGLLEAGDPPDGTGPDTAGAPRPTTGAAPWPLDIPTTRSAPEEVDGHADRDGTADTAGPEDDLQPWAHLDLGPGADPDDPGPGRIVRRKAHQSAPMSVDEALSQMELVGHDFFLFCDAATGRPSVVYRRRGYDYGVIALDAV